LACWLGRGPLVQTRFILQHNKNTKLKAKSLQHSSFFSIHHYCIKIILSFPTRIICLWIKGILLFSNSILIIIDLFKDIFIYFYHFNKQLNNQNIPNNNKNKKCWVKMFKYFYFFIHNVFL
jgi:hypothetical protein